MLYRSLFPRDLFAESTACSATCTVWLMIPPASAVSAAAATPR